MQKQVNNTFEQELIANGYQNVFQTNTKENYENIWKHDLNRGKLYNIISSKNSSLLGRFLASEVVFMNDAEINEKYYEVISESYVYALEKTNMLDENFIGINGNSWGFLYEEEAIGVLGKRLIKFGNKAIPHLTELLVIEGKVLYIGSGDALIGNRYQYRIKDFAAFYISKIKDIPMTFYQNFEKRDAEIERLKELLENE
ncbi:hypothetical protein [uncultured Kordia sp.]|uniref:hypothetical protein n=1 Tax=uncultured Kordia sp. TaxID=507699 RepID=UPI0026061692|nr:hypothetical protein [uncultured Kordia sp.]